MRIPNNTTVKLSYLHLVLQKQIMFYQNISTNVCT